MNITQTLAHMIRVTGNRRAIVCGASEYTWSQFAYRTDCLAQSGGARPFTRWLCADQEAR